MNKEIARLLGVRLVEQWSYEDGVHKHIVIDNTPDYLGDWNELMPLVIKYKMVHAIGREVHVGIYGHLKEGTYGTIVEAYGKTLQEVYCKCLIKRLKQLNKS